MQRRRKHRELRERRLIFSLQLSPGLNKRGPDQGEPIKELIRPNPLIGSCRIAPEARTAGKALRSEKGFLLSAHNAGRTALIPQASQSGGTMRLFWL
jgi:hypothetical protein